MPDAPHRCVVLIPAHNRREITVGAVGALIADDVATWATILVIDDGSTDGTAEAIAQAHPAVQLLRGDGTWWWAGAIRRGMEWALARGAEQIIWLNDDCHPPSTALRALHDRVRLTGEVSWIDALARGGWNYGGHVKAVWRIRRCTLDEEARGHIQTFSGNCVCLPRAAVEKVGLPHDHLFPHGLADLDYGLRLHAAGIVLRPLEGWRAQNGEPNSTTADSWLASTRPMREIWCDFSSPRSVLHFPVWRRFARRHWGPVWGLVVFAAPYARWLGIALVRPAWRSINSPNGREKDQG